MVERWRDRGGRPGASRAAIARMLSSLVCIEVLKEGTDPWIGVCTATDSVHVLAGRHVLRIPARIANPANGAGARMELRKH